MPRITDFNSLPVFAAAMPQGSAIAASVPFARPSVSQYGVMRLLKRTIAHWQSVRKSRRKGDALAVLSDNQLRDIGLNRANIVSAATEAGVPAHRIDANV